MSKLVGNVRTMVTNLVMDHPTQWHKYLLGGAYMKFLMRLVLSHRKC